MCNRFYLVLCCITEFVLSNGDIRHTAKSNKVIELNKIKRDGN